MGAKWNLRGRQKNRQQGQQKNQGTTLRKTLTGWDHCIFIPPRTPPAAGPVLYGIETPTPTLILCDT